MCIIELVPKVETIACPKLLTPTPVRIYDEDPGNLKNHLFSPTVKNYIITAIDHEKEYVACN